MDAKTKTCICKKKWDIAISSRVTDIVFCKNLLVLTHTHTGSTGGNRGLMRLSSDPESPSRNCCCADNFTTVPRTVPRSRDPHNGAELGTSQPSQHPPLSSMIRKQGSE